ncbi:MAG: hypothetical protein LBU79_06830 [Planctomycetota bacterium]|jgi:hypothetical protein|nr:hypothetical protein [Planctomycetota bacterium]
MAGRGVNPGEEGKDRYFAGTELPALLRLFSGLGFTLALGIVGFFLLGLYVDRYLQGLGLATRGIVVVVFLLLGVGLSTYRSYLVIARHLEKYGRKDGGKEGTP